MARFSTILLHAHVPWLRDATHSRSKEEDRCFELMLDCYLPLLQILFRLRDEGYAYRLGLALSPGFASLLRNPLMVDRAEAYLDAARSYVAAEVERGGGGDHRDLANWYISRIESLQEFYSNRCQRDLVGAFADLRSSGHLEILGSAATHPLLPLLLKVPAAVRGQIEVGCQQYELCFGERPQGFWLPECAYAPALEPFLAEAGITYTVLEAHGLSQAPGALGDATFRPARSQAGIGYLGRDRSSSRQIWSRHSGYPGDRRYRRQAIPDTDRDREPASPQEGLSESGPERFPHLEAALGRGNHTARDLPAYSPQEASLAAAEHARHFLESRAAQLADLERRGVATPLVVNAFGADLLGGRWFEGPLFLEAILRQAGERQDFQLVPPGAAFELASPCQEIAPVTSSWSEDGYFETWLAETNAWIYPHLHQRAGQLSRVATALHQTIGGLPDETADHRERCLTQMIRELMLAQSSDWARLMLEPRTYAYARERSEEHLARFDRLQQIYAAAEPPRTTSLEALERADPLFPNLDWTSYVPRD